MLDKTWPSGLMDKAFGFEPKDCGFIVYICYVLPPVISIVEFLMGMVDGDSVDVADFF
jgi:hypothetical protein